MVFAWYHYIINMRFTLFTHDMDIVIGVWEKYDCENS